MIYTTILSFFWKAIKSPWLWIGVLAVACYFLWSWGAAQQEEKERYKNNYEASSTFTGNDSKETVLSKKDLKKDEELLSILKAGGIKPKHVEYIYQVKWKEGKVIHDTIRDTIIMIAGVPVEAEALSLVDSCIQVGYQRVKGDSLGTLSYDYQGSLTVIGNWRRSKPKFWNWLGGKKETVVTVSSPCFGDTSIILNKMVKIE